MGYIAHQKRDVVSVRLVNADDIVEVCNVNLRVVAHDTRQITAGSEHQLGTDG